MQSTDRAEFVRVLNGLAAIKRVELTREALELWWSSMSRWDIAEFKSAASHLVGNCQFMPTPYDFQQLRRAGESTPNEAWDRAISASSSCYQITNAGANYGTGGTCGDAFIDRVVRTIGGYRALASADIEKDLPHIRRRFLEAYEELSDVESVRDAIPELTQRRIGRTNGFSQIVHELELDEDT